VGRVAVDFGVGQGASAASISAAIARPARTSAQRAIPRWRDKNQRNRHRREAEGQLAASLSRYSPLKGMRLPRSLPFALLPLRATHPSISTVS